MKLSLVNVVVFTTGGILMYSAIKDRDPRDVIRSAFGQPPAGSIGGGSYGNTTATQPAVQHSPTQNASTGPVVDV